MSDIKAHPAFTDGFPAGYLLPRPIPLQCREDRIDADGESLKLLYHLGYASIAEAKTELSSASQSMGKVFYGMYNNQYGIAALPWSTSFQVPEIPNQNLTGPSHRRSRYVYRSGPELSFETSDTWHKIRCSLPILMLELQKLLFANGYEFFHANEIELIARKIHRKGYVILTATQEADDLYALDVECPVQIKKDLQLTTEIANLLSRWRNN
jgi:hypothetical protein